MTAERLSELREQLFLLEKKIRPLDWDASKNQINVYKKKELERLKTEHSTLLQELNGLEQK